MLNDYKHIKHGYKGTKTSLVPSTWNSKYIKEVSETTSGGTPLRSREDYYKGGTIPWVKTGELNNRFIFGSAEMITEKAIKETSAKLIPVNAVLIAMYGATIGKLSITKDEVSTNQACCAIIPNDDLYTDYLYYNLLFNKESIISLGAGGAQPNISQQIIRNYSLLLPPYEEQQKIAAILTSVDEAIEKTKEIIEQTEKVRKGLTQQLLTKGIGHTEFKGTDIGEVPVKWELIPLESLTTESAFGPRFPSDKYDIAGNYALLRTTDINKSGNINYQTMPLAKLPEENFEKHVLRENDLLITRSGTCGIVTIFKGFNVPVIPGAFLIRFRLNKMINPEFAKLFMMSNGGQSKIQSMASGGVQKNLSGTNLKKLLIPIPEIEEQEKIVAVHKSIEEKISNEESTLIRFQNLKNALMQVLLTGQVRVQIEESEVITS